MVRLAVLLLFFFFQAEDGIRDLVRSRGLGDVYKRQLLAGTGEDRAWPRPGSFGCRGNVGAWTDRARTPALALRGDGRAAPVSYTHLTLPTSDLV